MGVLLGAAALFALVWWLTRRRRLRTPGLAVGSALLALGCFAAAAVIGMRGGWLPALGLAALGGWLVLQARVIGTPPAPPRAVEPQLSEREARELLGVSDTAGPEEVEAAYRRLMRRVHPDGGGSTGLAARLNAARERLRG